VREMSLKYELVSNKLILLAATFQSKDAPSFKMQFWNGSHLNSIRHVRRVRVFSSIVIPNVFGFIILFVTFQKVTKETIAATNSNVYG